MDKETTDNLVGKSIHCALSSNSDKLYLFKTGVLAVDISNANLIGKLQLTPATALDLAEQLITFAKTNNGKNLESYRNA